MVEIQSSSPSGVSPESAEATVSTSEHQIAADEPVTTVPIKKQRNLPGMPGKVKFLIMKAFFFFFFLTSMKRLRYGGSLC